MAYLLINQDNTVNYIGDHPVNKKLSFENLRLIELPDKLAAGILGDIPPDEAYWDGEKVVRDPSITENDSKSNPQFKKLKQLKNSFTRKK